MSSYNWQQDLNEYGVDIVLLQTDCAADRRTQRIEPMACSLRRRRRHRIPDGRPSGKPASFPLQSARERS